MKNVVKYVSILFAFTVLLVGCSLFGPEAAYDPSPADGATGVLAGIELSWTGADGASFEVYFGTSSSPTKVATVETAAYDPAPSDDLVAGSTYYWKVDTLKGTARTDGELWSFTVAP